MGGGAKEVPYIEKNGAAYIDTGYVPTGTDITVKCKIYQGAISDNSKWYNWFSAFVNNSTRCYRAIRRGNYMAVCFQMGVNGSGTGNDLTISVGSTYDMEVSYKKFTVNGVTKTKGGNDSTRENTSTMLILGGPGEDYAILRCYYFQLYKGDDLVLDMIPAENNGQAGMYDKVSGNFFGNAGTGTLTLGYDKT